jgi:ABC-type siderophore export system fused ATPase/permease subunit
LTTWREVAHFRCRLTVNRYSRSCSSKMRTVCLLAIVFVLVESPVVVGEVYTSMADMEALLETERELTVNVRNFIEAEEARIKQIKK